MTDDLNVLAHTLAYEFAVSVIESNCEPKSAEPLTVDNIEESWYSLAEEDGQYPSEQKDIKDCARYLDARGLLEHHPEHSDWVRLRDESEATTHFVLPRGPWTVVKTADFFRSQNGHIEDWGKAWVPVVARSIDAAREIGSTLPTTERA